MLRSLFQANVEVIRATDGAARAPHETCLRKAPDPLIGYALFERGDNNETVKRMLPFQRDSQFAGQFDASPITLCRPCGCEVLRDQLSGKSKVTSRS
jgi:hypothetical protein